MKILKHILLAVTMLSLTTACNHDPDDITVSSSDPAITKHADVVVNGLTIDEDFTLVWSAAKFGRGADVEYTLSAKSTGDYVVLGTTSATNFTCKNSELFAVLGIGLTGDYDVTFKVSATSGSEQKESKIAVVRFLYNKITYLWMFGDYQGWDVEGGPASRLLQGSDGLFKGFVNLPAAGEFKLASQPNWDGTNYGPGANAGELSSDNAPNFQMDAALYYMEVNLDAMTYVALKLETVSLIGEATGGWNDGDDVVMSYDAAQKTWTGIADLVAGKSYKVRFNKVWNIEVGGVEYDCSLGGSPAELQFKGSDLTSEGEGITGFTLSIFDYPYTIKEGAITENDQVLYIANSTTGWDYMQAVQMQAQYPDGTFNNTFCGVMELPSAGEYLFSRLQTPLGVRYGGSEAALVKYTGGEDATAMSAAQGLSYVYADLTEGAMKATTIGITSVGIVGGVNNWDASVPVEFTYDSSSKTWKMTQNFDADGEFKIIFNKMWNTEIGGVTHQMSMGGSCTDLRINGVNLFMTEGSHTLELNLAKTPFTLAIDGKIADLSADPDYLQLTGAFAHYDWNLGDPTPSLNPYKDKGRFAAFVDMYKPATATGEEAEFKVTYPGYSTWLGGVVQAGTTYTYDIEASNGDNMTIPYDLYFWDVTLDATAKTGVAKALAMKTVGVIGAVNGTAWSQDFNMTSKGEGVYSVDVTIEGEFKIRLHEDGFTEETAWLYSLGLASAGQVTPGTETALTTDGQNMTVPAPGNYTVTVNLAKSPNTITVVAK